MKIRSLEKSDLPAVKSFTDIAIGLDYFSLEDLEEILEKSFDQGIMCSLILEDEQKELQGIRLVYAPGKWQRGKTSHLRPDLWKVPLENVGYFQSLFISEDARGQHWGPKLSEEAMVRLQQLGARAIVAHAWKESPNNSSVRYLEKFGFESVIEHPQFWKDVNYVCTRDGNPCLCTAIEVIKYLEPAKDLI